MRRKQESNALQLLVQYRKAERIVASRAHRDAPYGIANIIKTDQNAACPLVTINTYFCQAMRGPAGIICDPIEEAAPNGSL
jgi:hypothetical protein